MTIVEKECDRAKAKKPIGDNFMPLSSTPEIKDVYEDKIGKPQPDKIDEQYILLNKVNGIDVGVRIGPTTKQKVQKAPAKKKAIEKKKVVEKKMVMKKPIE
jgi:hypothetical protein